MTSMLTGKPQLNRIVNRRLILDKVRRDGAISRADLAKQTAIRPPSVSAIVKELVEEGLVEEIGPGKTSGGRAPRMIALTRNQPRALGFEINDTSILAGVSDLTGNLFRRIRVPFTPKTPAHAIERMHKTGCKLLGEANVDWQKLHGVGVAVPGHLDVDQGVLRWSQALQWRDVPLKRMCEARWDVATDVVNDSFACAMAAQLFEKAQSVENLVFLCLRFQVAHHQVVGIGTGIIINGEPYHGEFGAAGEITTSVRHPLALARENDGQAYQDIADFTKAFQAGQSAAVSAMKHVGDELATLVLHIVNLLEPGILMVGSDTPILYDSLLDRFRRKLEELRLPHEAGKTNVIASTLGQYGVVRGAVVPTLQRVFRLPQWS